MSASDLDLLGRPWPHLAARLARTLGPDDVLLATPRRVEISRPLPPGRLVQSFWRDASMAQVRDALRRPPPSRRDLAGILGGASPERPVPGTAFVFSHRAGAPMPHRREDLADPIARLRADAFRARKALGRPRLAHLLAGPDALVGIDAEGRIHVRGVPARTIAGAELPATAAPAAEDPTLLPRLHAALPEGETRLPAPRSAHDRLALGLTPELAEGLRSLLNGVWPPEILHAVRLGPALVLLDRAGGARPDRPRLLALVAP